MSCDQEQSLCANILVVDDEESIRFFLQEMLEREGYQVVTAASGEQALRCIQAEEFDLALLDLKMAGIGGMEVIAALRQRWPDTVIIVLTAHASLETAVDALRHGAHDYLFKPCKTVELRNSISNGLQKRQFEVRRRQLLTQLERNMSQNLTELRAVRGANLTGPEKRHLAENVGADRSRGQDAQTVPSSSPLAPQPGEEGTRFLHCCGIIVDITRHVITLQGRLLELSPTEFNVLAYLVSEAPRVISSEELVREVQGYKSETWEADEIVRYHIYRIRRKIKEATGLSDIVRTVRGVGYGLKE